MERGYRFLQLAIFLALVNVSLGTVLISELMYNPRSNEDYFEYIELYNSGTAPIVLDGWSIPGISFTIPAGVTINAGQYLVIAKNPTMLQRIYSLSVTPLGPYTGDLSNKGEKIELKDSAGVVVSNITYDVSPPWSPLPKGFGASLELICPSAPNRLSSWHPSFLPTTPDSNAEYTGTPGAAPFWQNCLSAPFRSAHQVFISEIMFSPVQETTREDIHEFIEFYNNGPAPVPLANWRVISDNGMMYTFPAGATVPAKSVVIVAKDLSAFAAVYGTVAKNVFGPYLGELKNGKSGLAIVDSNGYVADYVEYDDKGNWPLSTDRLGGSQSELYTGNPFKAAYASYQFKGQSLSRRSYSWPSTSTYNWRETDPSPGVENQDPSNLPALSVSINPAINNIKSSSTVTVTGSLKPIPLSPGVALSATLYWFVDDVIFGTAPTVNAVTMTYNGDTSGTFTATIPPQADNAIVRYYVTADLAGSTGAVTFRIPRRTDPYQYRAYFVEPPRPGNTPSPILHMFIKRENWSQLYTNVATTSANLARVTDACTVRASWDQKVPAVLVYQGEVIDIKTRYQGSRWNRYRGDNMGSAWPGWATVGPTPDTTLYAWSWNLDIPSWTSIYGHRDLNFDKMHQGCTMFQSPLADQISEAMGVSAARGDIPFLNARININGYFWRIQGVKGTDFGDHQADLTTRLCLDHSVQSTPHLFKAKGANIDEAGWAPSDFRLIGETCGGQWPEIVRYATSYERKTNNWADVSRLRNAIIQNSQLTDGLLTPAAAKQWLLDNIDVNWLLTYHVLTNWAGTWDNTFQNQFYLYREEDKRIFEAVWDADRLFGEAVGTNADLYAGKIGYQTHYLRNNIISYLKPEFESHMRLMTATVFSDTFITPLLDSISAQWNLTEVLSCAGGWVQDFSTCVSNMKNWIPGRRDFVNQQLGTWAAVEGTDPWQEVERRKCPTRPTLTRRYNDFNPTPGEVLETTVTEQTYSKLTVTWTAPNSWKTSITGYKLVYSATSAGKRQGSTTVTLPASPTTFSLDNPGGSMTYTVTITPLSPAGEGN